MTVELIKINKEVGNWLLLHVSVPGLRRLCTLSFLKNAILFLLKCVFVCGLCVSMCPGVQMPKKAKDVEEPETGVTAHCELPDLGAGN